MLQLLFIVLGLVFGSFATVLVDRAPWGRSRCPKCKHQLSPLELVPVVSYIALRGQCRNCKKPISSIYPLVELSSAGLFLLALTLAQALIPSLLLALALWLLFVMSIIDYRTQLISDALSIPLILLGVLYSLVSLQFTLESILIGGGFFGVLWIVSRGKWIGSGDILLGAGIGALVGPPRMIIASLFLTYIVGALLLSVLLLLGVVKRKSHIPFAPLLSLGALLTIVFQDRIEILLRVYFGV